MATDFQLIEAYDVDIENFDYDVSDIVDSIYIGPQGDLLEKLELFNHNYNTKLGVTKSFTLKPGGYDEIKQAHARWVLRYDMKPRGINSIFDRMNQYSWRLQHFKQQITEIDTRMQNLKRSGMRWQDNTDQFEEEFDKIKSSIVNSLNQVREMYPNVSIECKIIPVSEGRLLSSRRHYGDRQNFPTNMFSTETVDFVIMFYVKIKNTDMMIHVMDDDSAMAEYRMSMSDVYIASGTYLLPLISRHWGRTTPYTANPAANAYSFFLEALYLSEMGYSEHPYIGRHVDKYSWELGSQAYSGNICTGNMGSDIRNSLLNNEIMAHIVQLITWMTTYYVPQTNPLNRIKKIRAFGDDIKFIQWRNDLNATSTTVFPSNDDMPHSCGFAQNLHGNMLMYAKNEGSCYTYRDISQLFDRNSIEYPLRIEEYLKKIDLADMPCNNCGFKSECEQWKVLQLAFKDTLTPEEESCFGMLYEFHDFEVNIRTRSDTQDHVEIHFVEMAINEAYRWHLDRDYLLLTMCHKMAYWWSYLNDESFNTSSNRYRRRMRRLYSMNINDMKHLFEHHYLNEESEMAWTMDSIQGYRAPRPDARLDERITPDVSIENDEVVAEWLNSDDDETAMPFGDNLGRPAPLPVDEDMTPEQRSIQWAIQHGGANNL